MQKDLNTYEDLSRDELELLLAYHQAILPIVCNMKEKRLRLQKIEVIKMLLNKL